LEARELLTVNVLGTFQGLNYGNAPGSVPPDTIAAVGPSEVVETVNSSIAIYNKGGTPVLNPTSLGTFFQSVGPINTLSDSVVAYDELNGKFFVGVLNLTTTLFGTVSADSFLYAVSNTSSPTSASDFQFQSVNLTGLDPAGSGSFWGDFPRIGWNANEYVATFNMFTNNILSPTYDHALVLNISSATPGTTKIVDVPGGVTNATLAPATMHGAAASDPMYFVEETLNSSGNFTGNSIRVVSETSPFATPTFGFTDVPLPASDDYTSPPSATQKGSTNLIQTNDSRVLNAEWRGNHLVAAQAIGVASDAQAHARWYEFDTTSTPKFVQAGTIGVGSGANSYFPSIAIAANDVLAMDYMESSPTEYMSMYVTGRVSSDASNQMETPVLTQAGQAPYQGFDTAPYRAGDFSGINVDGDGTFWAANEYATSSTSLPANWGTAIAHFQIGNPAQPPTVTQPASATLSSDGKSASLSVVATDPNPGATITSYTWSVSGPSGVTFSSTNGTASGNNTTASFTQTGAYTFTVSITDSLGASSTSTTPLTVGQVLTSIAVSPATATVVDGTTKQFTATARDQFNVSMATQPTFAWSVAPAPGAGSINSTGLYTAPANGSGKDTVQASANGVPGIATVNYSPTQPPTVTQPASATLSSDGKSASLSVAATDPNPGATITSYTWSVSGPSGVTFSSTNGTASGNKVTATFTQTGTYTFMVTITDSLGESITSTTPLTVGQVLTSIVVSPANANVPRNTTLQFKATARDQFGLSMAKQPTFVWSIDAGGKGSISSTGLYKAPKRGTGTATIRATVGSISGTAVVTIV
jgi:hypothetical protein